MPPGPAGTGAVDAAIRTFAVTMPYQSAKVQSGSLEQMSSQLSSSLGQQSTARDIALFVNTSCALNESLAASNKSPVNVTATKAADVERSFQELLHVCSFVYVPRSANVTRNFSCSRTLPYDELQHKASAVYAEVLAVISQGRKWDGLSTPSSTTAILMYALAARWPLVPSTQT